MRDESLIYASDNEYGIPALPLGSCATGINVPFLVWGFQRRQRKAGTLAFYTDDYRFNAIWSNPAQLLVAEPISVIEPNFTIQDHLPRAVVLWHTYRKRWLAKHWSGVGVKIIVDLNVSPIHKADNLLGVPKGWHAFATRGASDDIKGLHADYETALSFAPSPLFVVYGGGKAVMQECLNNSWHHIPEAIDRHGQ